ncbi:hypothetical protein LTS17_007960 [Exophiala oligosperma]
MASRIHEITVGFLYQHFIRLFDQVFSKTQRDRITICTNLRVNGFTEEYRSSIKTPDIGIFVRNDDNTQDELKWALEIGFSQKYDDLQDDLRLWLVGQPACSMAVLINITESPDYQCPLDFDLAICDELDTPQEGAQITAREFSLEGEYGPVMFKGYQWVGRISEVFLEIWTRNPRTGDLRRKGRRMPIIPPSEPSPQLDLADFLFDDNPQMTFFDWDDFRAKLKDSLRFLAVWRCLAQFETYQLHKNAEDDRGYRYCHLGSPMADWTT